MLPQAVCIISLPSVNLNCVTVWKRSIRVKKIVILCRVWSWNITDDLEKTIGHLFYATSSFVHNFVAISESKLELSPETPNLGQNRWFFVPRDIEICRMTLKNLF